MRMTKEVSIFKGVPLEAINRSLYYSQQSLAKERRERKPYTNQESTFDQHLLIASQLYPASKVNEIHNAAQTERRLVRLLDLFSSGGSFDKDWLQGVAVTLTDLRTNKVNPRLEMIEENLTQNSPWQRIDRWRLSKGDFDLIFSWPEYDGFKSLGFFAESGDKPNIINNVDSRVANRLAASLYFAMMNEAYKMLNIGGMLLFQWPDVNNIRIDLGSWHEDNYSKFRSRRIFANHPLELEIAGGRIFNSRKPYVSEFFLKLLKNEGAPESLGQNPFCSAER